MTLMRAWHTASFCLNHSMSWSGGELSPTRHESGSFVFSDESHVFMMLFQVGYGPMIAARNCLPLPITDSKCFVQPSRSVSRTLMLPGSSSSRTSSRNMAIFEVHPGSAAYITSPAAHPISALPLSRSLSSTLVVGYALFTSAGIASPSRQDPRADLFSVPRPVTSYRLHHHN